MEGKGRKPRDKVKIDRGIVVKMDLFTNKKPSNERGLISCVFCQSNYI